MHNDESHEAMSMTAEIVSNYVGNNTMPAADVPALIRSVREALLGDDPAPAVVAPEQPVPAVPVDQSVGGDAIACLCCGRAFKSLKRHLMAGHKMTPDEYRAAWVLGKDYPMVAPNYAEQRSALALSIGFGRKTEPAASVAEPAPVVEVAPVAPPAIVAPVAAKRGRKPKPNGAGAHA